jgi:PAS domain S-box-containing protein
MNAAVLAGAVAGFLLALGAVASLWRGSLGQAGAARSACWWFAAAAVVSCANLIVGQAAAFPAGSTAMDLSFADLPGFLLLPVMAVGLNRLAASAPGPVAEPLPPRRSRRGLMTLGAHLVDGYLLASALFVAGWVIVFGPVFTTYGGGAGTFAAELVHPVAGLVFLGIMLAAAGAAGRRGLLPYLALAAMTGGDSLAVAARITGSPPGVAALIAQLAALGLLALAPWTWGRWPAGLRRAGGAPWMTTGAAAVAAAAAAVLAIGQAAALGRLPEPVVLLVLGVALVALGARVVALVKRVNSWARVWQESGKLFRQLAERTSDVVLICDLAGVIRFASRAVTGYGYTPENLAGLPVTDLLHPEDQPGGVRALHKAVTATGQRTGRYPCRVRAADGTWRHVESTVSRYRHPGGPDQLLVTARDITAQMELRRQITHLTFHDVLTGLPNRAYMERRAEDLIAQSANGAATDGTHGGGPDGTQGGGTDGTHGGGTDGTHGGGTDGTDGGAARRAVAVAIVLGVDGFVAFNESGGRGAGDLLLAQIARRLRLTVSPQDTVARWGGDQFAVLVEGPDASGAGADSFRAGADTFGAGADRFGAGADTVRAGVGSHPYVPDVAERLARRLPSEPFRLGNRDVTVTVSVGVAFADGRPAGQVWRRAELAMARARELGGDRVEVFHDAPPGTGPAPCGPPEAAAAGAAAQ